MLCNLRNLSFTALSLAIGLQLAAPVLAIPPDIASRAGRYARRAAEERNVLREQDSAKTDDAYGPEEIPAEVEIADDVEATERVAEPVGTGARNAVRRAAHEEFIENVPPRRGPRPLPGNAQRAGYSSNPYPGRNVRNSFVPSHERMASRGFRGPDQYINGPMTDMEEGEELAPPQGKRVSNRNGQPMSGEPIYEGEYYDEGDGYYGPGYGPGRCGRNWGDNCDPCCFQLPRLGYFEAFAGAHGFTGPLNRGTGSFGFQEGFNAGLPTILGLTMQGGINATQSNFQGSPFTPDDRTQLFTTLGLFRRVDCGLQAGIAIDYLHDNWDYQVDLTQLRGEFGWKLNCGNELGFWFTVGLDQTTTNAQVPFFGNNSVAFRSSVLSVEPVDIYAFYYRRQFAFGGEGRAFGGFTDDSRGLLGGNIRLPINQCWQFSTDFTYVVANNNADFRFNDESWNVSFNLVWTPCRGSGGCQNYCRPLLDVANNGSFLTRLR